MLSRKNISLMVFLLTLSNATLPAAEPAGYYNATAGLTGSALRTSLNTIVRTGHSLLSYSATKEALEITDEDPANPARVLLIYSGESKHEETDWINNNSADGWNREHVWPNSLGIDDGLPYPDLFNLRPCDEQSNSTRGNLYFDESTTGSGYFSPGHSEAPLCTRDGDSWEPRNSEKGDIARSMFYMDIRYEGIGGGNNLQLTDNVSLITTSNNNMGRLSTLLVWHFIDPVDDAERLRNDRVYGQQGNRNPFIDRPEFVEKIYGDFLKLQIAAESATTQKLTWPLLVPDGMWSLHTSTSLTSWSPLTITPVTSGSNRTTTVNSTGTNRYYVLRLNYKAG
jgi:endonuclease I